MTRQQRQGAAVVRRVGHLGIGLVEHDDNVAGNAREERFHRFAAEPCTGRIVRIGDVYQFCRLCYGRGDRIEIVAERHGRVVARQRFHHARLRARALRRQREHREAITRKHDFVALAREHLRELHQQLVGTVTQQDLADIDTVPGRESAFQVETERIGIAMQRMQLVEDRHARGRRRTVRVFVGTELDQRVAELAPECDEIVARVVRAQTLDTARSARCEPGFVVRYCVRCCHFIHPCRLTHAIATG